MTSVPERRTDVSQELQQFERSTRSPIRFLTEIAIHHKSGTGSNLIAAHAGEAPSEDDHRTPDDRPIP